MRIEPAKGRARRELISVVFRTPLAFARSRIEGAPVDGIFLPRPDLEVGQEVDVEIEFADSGVVIRGPGVVRWRRLAGSKAMRPGVGLEFAPNDPSRRMLLHQFAEGTGTRILVARSRRIAARFAVEYAVEGQPPKWTMIRDLSAGGAFLRDADDLVPGARVRLLLVRPGAKALRIDAVVAWSRPHLGAGVRFVPSDEALRFSIASLVEATPRTSRNAGTVSAAKEAAHHEEPREDGPAR